MKFEEHIFRHLLFMFVMLQDMFECFMSGKSWKMSLKFMMEIKSINVYVDQCFFLCNWIKIS